MANSTTFNKIFEIFFSFYHFSLPFLVLISVKLARFSSSRFSFLCLITLNKRFVFIRNLWYKKKKKKNLLCSVVFYTEFTIYKYLSWQFVHYFITFIESSYVWINEKYDIRMQPRFISTYTFCCNSSVIQNKIKFTINFS